MKSSRPMDFRRIAARLALALGLLAAPAPARAQITGGREIGGSKARSGQTPRQLEGVGVDEQMGETIPLDLAFRNEQGKKVKLGSYFDGETPVVLTLNYHTCPMLCGLQLQGFAGKTLRQMEWAPGEKFEVLTVDFNPREGPKDAREAKKRYLQMLGNEDAAAGWHFLTGDAKAIDRLTDAVGFRYRWLEEQKQYAHPAAYVFLSGTGKITRYLGGLTPKSRDARLALIEAGDGKVGSLAEQIYLSCCQFDPEEGSYVASAWKFTKLVCYFLAALLAGLLIFMWRLERGHREQWEEQLASREGT